MSAIVELHKKLIAEWGKDAQRNLATVEKILADIKAATIQPGSEQGLDAKALSTVYRDVYQISALSAALRDDLTAFDVDLTDAIRAKIATCMSKSFKKVPVTDAVSLLIFKTPAEVIAFAKQRGWTLEANNSILVLAASMEVDAAAKEKEEEEEVEKKMEEEEVDVTKEEEEEGHRLAKRRRVGEEVMEGEKKREEEEEKKEEEEMEKEEEEEKEEEDGAEEEEEEEDDDGEERGDEEENGDSDGTEISWHFSDHSPSTTSSD